MWPAIQGQIPANAEGIKLYLPLNMNFCKSISSGVKTDLAVMFCSEVFKSIDTHKLHYQFHVGYNQIVQQINEFWCNGSGWILGRLQHLDIGTCFLEFFK